MEESFRIFFQTTLTEQYSIKSKLFMFSTVMFSFNLYSLVCYVPFLFLVNEAIRIKLILSVK